MELIWYACYGSNMSQARFNCYISGGVPEGSTKIYEGCTDKTLPIKSEPITIPGSIYFAKISKTWHNGGVAFLNPDVAGSTPGRRYLITKSQFIDLLKQEIKFKGLLDFDMVAAIENKQLNIRPNSWYGKIIFLGQEEEIPIFTFTNSIFLEQEINEPSIHYLNTIRTGLTETYGFNSIEIDCYLSDKQGIL